MCIYIIYTYIAGTSRLLEIASRSSSVRPSDMTRWHDIENTFAELKDSHDPFQCSISTALFGLVILVQRPIMSNHVKSIQFIATPATPYSSDWSESGIEVKMRWTSGQGMETNLLASGSTQERCSQGKRTWPPRRDVLFKLVKRNDIRKVRDIGVGS